MTWAAWPHAADRPPTRLGEPSTAPGRVEGGGQPVLSFEQCFILFSSFPLLFAFVVGGLGFEFCVFVAGWRNALRSEWPFIIIMTDIDSLGPGECLHSFMTYSYSSGYSC